MHFQNHPLSNPATLRKISLVLLAFVSLVCAGTVFFVVRMSPQQTQTSASVSSKSSGGNSRRNNRNNRSNQNRRDRSGNGVVITPTPVHKLAIELTRPPLPTDSTAESLISSSLIDRSATDGPETNTVSTPTSQQNPLDQNL